MRTRALIWLSAACAIAAAGAGCAGGGVSDYAREYPATLAVTRPLDIQVVREPTSVRLTNSTSREFGRCTLWLNQWYSRPLPELRVGQSLELPLAQFVDVHSEVYRGGGFFAPRQADPLVSAHIETESEIVPLVVVRNRDN